MNDPTEALTISEACAASRIGRTRIYDAINEGRLVARKLGRKTLILRSDLLQFLEALPSMTAAVEPVPVHEARHSYQKRGATDHSRPPWRRENKPRTRGATT
jgi:excisionase family DNA binding protein